MRLSVFISFVIGICFFCQLGCNTTGPIDAEEDHDTDSNTMSQVGDGDTGTSDSNTECEIVDYQIYHVEGAEELPCVFEISMPSTINVDPGIEGESANQCGQVQIFGVPPGEGDFDNLETVTYVPDCASEGTGVGWNWVNLPGYTLEEINALGTDVSKCNRIQLCPNACSQLLLQDGIQHWVGLGVATEI